MDVRRAATFLLLFAFLNSCVHASRKPAQAPEQPGCDEGFRKVFPLETMDNLTGELEKSRKFKNILSSVMSAKLKAAMSPAPASCDREMRLQDLKYDFDLRIYEVEKSIARAQQFEQHSVPMASSPILNDPKLVEVGICFTECLEQAGEAHFYGKRGECAQSCDMKDPDEEGREVAALANLIVACKTDDNKIDRARVKKNFEQYFYSFASFIRANQTAINKDNAETAKVVEVLKQQRQKFAKFFAKREKPKMACSRPQPKTNLKIAEATHAVGINGLGSGFVVKDGENRRMVTAAHVYDKSARKNLNGARGTSVMAAFVGKGVANSQQSMEFLVEPGMQNFANDISTAEYTKNGEAFDLVESGTRPDPKTNFYIAGFPESHSGFQIYPCEFKGISLAKEEDLTPAYAFECHYTKGPIQGMSGGPAFDDQGRAWGVVSAQINLLNLIIVRPIFKDKDGKLVLGFSETASSEHCLTDDYQSLRTCQIVPGASEAGL